MLRRDGCFFATVHGSIPETGFMTEKYLLI